MAVMVVKISRQRERDKECCRLGRQTLGEAEERERERDMAVRQKKLQQYFVV